MAKFSEARIEAISLAVMKELKATDSVEIVNEGQALGRIAKRLLSELGQDPELDRAVRERIASLSRNVPEGSSEWSILYRQYSEELARRHR